MCKFSFLKFQRKRDEPLWMCARKYRDNRIGCAETEYKYGSS